MARPASVWLRTSSGSHVVPGVLTANDRLYAFLNLVVGALLGLLSPVVLHLLTQRRERTALLREIFKAKVERVRGLFADALKELHRAPNQVPRDDAGQEAGPLIAARLLLDATPAIRDKFNEVAAVLNRWTQVRRELDPKPLGATGLAVRTIRTGDAEQDKAAHELLVRAEELTAELAGMMRKHLQELEEGFTYAGT